MKRVTRRRFVAGALLLVPALAAVALHDVGAVRSAAASLSEDEDGLHRRIGQIRAARTRSEALEDELAKEARDVVRLQAILPYGLDVDAFREDLEVLAAPFGVHVQENATSFEKDGRLLTATMKVLFHGPSTARQAFLVRLSRRARQNTLEILEERDDFLRGRLTFWAYEAPKDRVDQPCVVRGVRVPWTPIGRGWVARSRSRCLRLLEETHGGSQLDGDLTRFENLKDEIRELVEEINVLQERHQEAWKKTLSGKGTG